MASVFGSASPQVLIQQDPRLQRRLALAQNLQQQGSSTAPVQHPMQALARALQGYLGGRAQYQAEQELKRRQAGATQGLTSALQAATTRPQLPGPNVEDPAALSEDFSASQFNPGTGQMVTPPPGGTAFNAEPSLGQAPGIQGAIAELLKNPDLAHIGAELQLGQLGNEQKLKQQIRLEREKAALRPAKDGRPGAVKIADELGLKGQDRENFLRASVTNPKSQITFAPDEKEEQKKLGGGRATRFNTLQDRADAAQNTLNNLEIAETIKVTSGALEPFKASVGAIAEAFGVSEDTLKRMGLGQAANAQKFNGIMKNLVLSKMQAQKGPQTESDMRLIQQTVAGMKQQDEARRFLLRSAKALSRRVIMERDFKQAWQEDPANKGSLKGSDTAWNKFLSKTPLAGKNPTTGKTVFFSEYARDAAKATVAAGHPEPSENDLLNSWRAKYGRK